MTTSTRTRIKICGLTREEDVDAAADAGADAVGFVMYAKSPRYVSADRAAELVKRLPPFVTPVLLFVNAPAIEIIASCARIPGALLQFHGDETPETCLAAGRPFLRAARIPLDEQACTDNDRFDLVKYARTDINGQRFTARPDLQNAIDHVCRRQPTRQNEVSVDAWRKK